MRSSIGAFALRFAATVLLFAPDGFARDPNSVNLCPPSLRMTEQNGCQPSNSIKSGTLLVPLKNSAAEQWEQIVFLVKNTPLEVQSCVWRGPLRSGWTLDGANAEISRCQREAEVSDVIRSIPSPEIRSCVWTRPLRNNLSLEAAKTEISRCRDKIREQEAELVLEWIICISAVLVLLALTIWCRVRIAARLYNLFVGCLALRLRLNRFRKRFLDKAIKEAETRLG
jgi:hypothetical protein